MNRPNRVNQAYELIGATPVARLNRLVPTGVATVFPQAGKRQPKW